MRSFKDTVLGIVVLGVISSLGATYIWENRSKFINLKQTNPADSAEIATQPHATPTDSANTNASTRRREKPNVDEHTPASSEGGIFGKSSENLANIPNANTLTASYINEFLVEPHRVESQRNCAVLLWSLSGEVTHASLDNGIGFVPKAQVNRGTRIVTPFKTTTYTLTAGGPGGMQSRSATIEVTERSAQQYFSRLSLSAEPTCIFKGESSVIKWSTAIRAAYSWDKNGVPEWDSINIDNGIGSVPNEGEWRVSPTETTTFEVTAKRKKLVEKSWVTVQVVASPE